ncbi:sulfatase [Engelhardtia mirabilis]|uniref:Choline-sulfatase n=1 Tax=Engelhardtia mirabilis TaxID=2528011 RepID=A0A518BHG8_9BACT|nr:Choline-sulfatase [Planctomycetes bacterium Pla133]QDV00754.1 Choline-sulfatase [Planctomycetes bacterium Pla86]
MSVRQVAARCLVLLTAWGLGSCGASDPPRPSSGAAGEAAAEPEQSNVESLLARTRFERVRDVVDYLPSDDGGFGDRDLGGWRHITDEIGERSAVATNQGLGRLRLSAADARDRRVEIVARIGKLKRGGKDQVPGPLSATLGGMTIELGQLTEEWREYAFEAPAALWREGDNQLTLDATGDEFEPQELLAVARVRVLPSGTAGAVDSADSFDVDTVEPVASDGSTDPEHIGLFSPSEAVRLPLTGIDGAQLTLAVESPGDGELAVRLTPRSTVTGLLGDTVLEEFLAIDAGAPRPIVIGLPAAAPPLAELELRWYPSDERSAARLIRADLARTTPAPPRLVVFLSVDTLSAQNMSLYGYERPTTPFLEQLAVSSYVFDRCSSNSGWTLPSYVSQLSALLPNSNRLVDPDERIDRTIWSEYQLSSGRFTLGELMNSAGYRTAAIVDNPFLAYLRGLDQGFDRLDVSPSDKGHYDLEGGMVQISRTALEWIDEWDGERPLFLFLQVLDVHGPYLTSAPWRDTFRPAEPGPLAPISGPQSSARGSVPEYIARGAREMGFDGAEDMAPIDQLLASYDEKVLEIDARIEAFLAELEARGLRDELLFVLSADHGEMTTQRDMLFFHGPVFEPSTHVPLLIDPPGQLEGRRIEDRVQLVDLMGTLAEFIGLDPEPFAQHGRSLVPLLRGEALEARPIVIQTTFRNQRAVIHGDWKLVLSEPWLMPELATSLTYPQYWEPWAKRFPELARELVGSDDLSQPPIYDRQRFDAFEARHPKVASATRHFFHGLGPSVSLYNLAQDPGELTDVSAAHPEVMNALVDVLGISEQLTVSARAAVAPDDLIEHLSDEALKELEALGYLDGDDDPAPSPDGPHGPEASPPVGGEPSTTEPAAASDTGQG